MKKTKKTVLEEMFFAGFGGQGIMFMGKLLAHAGLSAGLNITWMPSYGAEVRGGTAYSMTKISDSEIPGPVVARPDILVVMNRPSLLKYASAVKDGGVIISNRSLAGDVPKPKGKVFVNIPMTEIAYKLGDVKCANMVAIGALAKRSRLVSLKDISAALKTAFKDKEELYARNRIALMKGYKW